VHPNGGASTDLSRHKGPSGPSPQQRHDGSPPRQTVTRPVPKAQTDDPRAFQIGQIQRRFKPDITESDDSSILTFQMNPSDPDFPYEIEHLQCVLQVPATYPKSKPSLKITNQDIPRGFQINIERGFDTIATSSPDATLLGLMNRLDKQLETILSGQMAETVTLVSHRAPPQPPTNPPALQPQPERRTIEEPQARVPQVRQYTSEERSAAVAKRSAHTRQLEARFGRLQAYARSSDGRTYTLPLDSPKKASWPTSLQSVRSFNLIVPEEYPLKPPSISFVSKTSEAEAVERGFRRRCEDMMDLSLTQRINDLTLHIPAMASEPAPAPAPAQTEERPVTTKVPPKTEQSSVNEAAVPAIPSDIRRIDDRPHLHVIPRPPEWDEKADADNASETQSDSYESSSDEEGHQEEEAAQVPAADQFPTASNAPEERGVLMSFPHIELPGIELLELSSLNITIKCERCKDTMDVQKLRSYDGTATAMRQQACKKCATGLAVGFRADMIHANSARAGYLDLEGCTVIDMLPRYCSFRCDHPPTA